MDVGKASQANKHGPSDDWRVGLPQPIPSLGAAAYEEEKRLALESSPMRRANYKRFQQSARRGAAVDYMPIKLDIENVSRCNFRCTMCQVSEWPKLKRAEDMPFDAFKHLVDHQPGLLEIKLQGMGEPTLGGDTFYEMIRYARSKNIWVRTVTNASMLHLRDNYRKLIDSGANEVQISIDGSTKETFEKIRAGSRFEVVKRNSKLINDYADSTGRHVTKMWTVVQRDNFDELSALVDLSHELGFKNMVLSIDLTDWGQKTWREHNKAISRKDMMTRELADQLLDRAKDLGLELGFWTIASKYDTSTLEELCPWPFERSYVSSDMRIVPCCMLANPEVSDLGDAWAFAEEWDGSKYREFRQAHLDGRIPMVCKACYRRPGRSEDKAGREPENVIELQTVD